MDAFNTSVLLWAPFGGLRSGESISKNRLVEQLVNMQEKTVSCISYFKQGRLRLKSWMATAAVYYCFCHYYYLLNSCQKITVLEKSSWKLLLEDIFILLLLPKHTHSVSDWPVPSVPIVHHLSTWMASIKKACHSQSILADLLVKWAFLSKTYYREYSTLIIKKYFSIPISLSLRLDLGRAFWGK